MSSNLEFAFSKLSAFKERMLDLTARNRMINSNFSARSKQHFRIIDEVPQQIYEKLMTTSMIFIPLPPIEKEPSDESSRRFKERLIVAEQSDAEYLDELKDIQGDLDTEIKALRKLKNRIRTELGMPEFLGEDISLEQHAKDHNINPSFDLPVAVSEDEKKHQDRRIQTLFLKDQLKAYINNIERNYKSSQKEAGVNPLYMCFGFVEWYQSDSSHKKLTSPLLMLQVQLEKQNQGGQLLLSSTGDEISINLTLNEKFKKEFNFELPPISKSENEEDTFSIEEYFKKVEKEITNPQKWKLNRRISFGIYNAQNMPIYRDIEEIESKGKISKLLTQLLVGVERESGQGNVAEVYEVDSKDSQKLIPALVTDADSSQFSAVVDALTGKNIVLKGPPGTGKSQTITNIIASLCSAGKKVLFVAQKQAALDVVRNNLEAIGSKDYLLEIFSIKANKKAVMESIRARNTMQAPPTSLAYEADLNSLNSVKEQLNLYADFINSSYEKTDKTIHEIIWDQIDLGDADLEAFSKFKVKNPQSISDSELDNGIRELSFLKDFCKEYFGTFNVFSSELRSIQKKITNVEKQNEIKNEIEEESNKLQEITHKLEGILNISPALSNLTGKEFLENKLIAHWCEEIKDGGDSEEFNETIESIRFVLSYEDLDELSSYLKKKGDLRSKEENFKKESEHFSSRYDFKGGDESLYSLKDIKSSARELLETNFFSYFKSEWWSSRKLYNTLCIVPKEQRNLTNTKVGEELESLYKFFLKKDSTEEKISSLKGEIQELENKFSEQAGLSGIDINFPITNQKFLVKVVDSVRNLNSEFRENWLSNPSGIKDYSNTLGLLSISISRCKEHMKSLEISFEPELPKELGEPRIYLEFNQFFSNLANQLQYLQDYMRLLVQEELIKDENAKEFYKFFNLSGADVNKIAKFFKYFVRRDQKNHIHSNLSDDLAKYDGIKIENLRKQLSELDKKVTSKYQKEVANKIHNYGSEAPPGISTGRVREKTDLGLVNHLSNVTNPRMSIREFIGNAGSAVMALKPCTLMSPLTVSQTLPLKEIFDVVVIDEASQMRPEYAIGAIARAKQAIIVGDPQQLPPTSFFQSTSSEDEFDDDLSDESILDMAITVFFPPRELLWHYRSRHQDLIRFSNAKFYKNLLIPVTANTSERNKGISYNYIEGIYMSGSGAGSGGINPIEAKEVVKDVVQTMKERPNESIGVATMNIRQKELIQNEFDLIASKDTIVLKYLTKWSEKSEGLEEFFVKNLENVQGDERDIIFISTVYGPNQTGRVYQRFGPINSKFGARRLNVLFSRAKNEKKIFTSLKASQIQTGDASSLGVSVFKDYLTFIETGLLQEGEALGEEVQSPFQQWAIDQINSFPGFSADWEIGVQGYSIDVGVKHEDYPHGYILAVETDGASYHSSRSARDRDKLRQGILESYDWVFHRIWSTDWLNNPLKVRKKLGEVLNERLEELLKGLKEETREEAFSEDLKPIEEDKPRETLKQINKNGEEVSAIGSIETYPYVIMDDLYDYIHIDPKKFYTRSYRSGLENAVINIIDKEGPISFEILVERIRKAHGFGKAGREIRTTIASLIPKECRLTTHKHKGKEKKFYWPEGFEPKEWRGARYPQSDHNEEMREVFDVSPQEIHAIARLANSDNSPNSPEEDEISKFITDYLGWSRCTEVMKSYIDEVLSKEFLN